MKCLVLAGGMGERLWPLSRRNFPKQFIKVQKNHSIFQETIARNIPYCDEFIIVTNYEYRSIIANQMEAFQGLPYRCVYEEEPRKTTAAIVLSCLSLQPSEYVFVVAADHLIDTGECRGIGYKESILKAKEFAGNGAIVLFGKKADRITERFGYFTNDAFYEKPGWVTIKKLKEETTVCQNLGMLLFQNGTFMNEMRNLQPDVLAQCRAAYDERIIVSAGTFYSSETLRSITPVSIEHAVIEKSEKRKGVKIDYDWSDVGSLEDLSKTKYRVDGIGVQNECANTIILNQSPRQAVVVNDLDNVLVVNTEDAVYIGRRGKSHLLKQIIHDNPALEPYTDQGITTYRPWGYYDTIVKESVYQVRKVVLLPGKTIYEHRHKERKETWTIIQGRALITLDGESKLYGPEDSVEISAGTAHQISNSGEEPVIYIDTAVGNVLHTEDLHIVQVNQVTETDLGLLIDPMVKLSPSYKDYLWGGVKLREIYGKKCDYSIIAESWELSAHPAGNSIVATGRHKGLAFSKYIELVGRSVLGWKCMQDFPLLIKFIDARDNLSIQVHPDDDYALEYENEYGKNEMWYVIESEPGAGLYVGFNKEVDRDEVERRVKDNTILDILNFYPTKAGDVFFIPAGTVHAIGAGNLICEIQQSSNTTYRLYDYNRQDKFGNPRELHLQKALDVLNYEKYVPVELKQDEGKIRCKYFEVEMLNLDGKTKAILTDDSFYVIVCIKGSGIVDLAGTSTGIKAGETIFIPATNETLHMEGHGSLMLARI